MDPLASYKRTRIMTASPGELLVMLYDGLLQRVRGAVQKLDAGDIAAAGALLGRSQDILHELMSSLDRSKAPELVDGLMALYVYCSERLIECLAERDTKKLVEVYDLLKPLRDAWAEANQSLKSQQKVVNG